MKIFLSNREERKITGGVGLTFCGGQGTLGGFSAQMLENPRFEAEADSDGSVAGWEAYPAAGAAELKTLSDRPMFPEKPNYLRLSANAPGAGAKNRAFGGLFLKKGEKYRISFFARSNDFRGRIKAGLFQGDNALFEKKFRIKPDRKQRGFGFTFSCKKDVRADFAVLLLGAGTAHFDAFSMLPVRAVKGIFRRDLIAQMKMLKPDFVQFPVLGDGAADYAGYFLMSELFGAKPLPLLLSEREDAAEEFLREFAPKPRGPFAFQELAVQSESRAEFEAFCKKICEKYPDFKFVYHPVPQQRDYFGNRWKDTLCEAAELLKREQEGTFFAEEIPPILFGESAKTKRCLLGCEADKVFETADFHVRSMFSYCSGAKTLKTVSEGEMLISSASEREGTLFLKVANLSREPVLAAAEGDFEFGGMTRVLCLAGGEEDCNSFDEPEKIKPVEIAPYAENEVRLPPLSLSVLVFRK